MFSAVLAIANKGSTLRVSEIIAGISCFCAWISVIAYLEKYEKAYTIIDTLKRTTDTLLPYSMGIIPIFVAFTLLGMSIFW
jgi:hypothetical protein